MNIAARIVSPLAHLFFPHVCAACGSDVIIEPNLLCLQCIQDLPHTFYARLPDNPVEKIFWGRIELSAAMSECYFSKGTIVQSLIHQLKYKGNKKVGFMLGNIMGKSLLDSNRFMDVDAIVPLPLNSKRARERGYNQSEILCNGISKVLGIPVLNGIVIRTRSTETQTKKRRGQRWENVEGSFDVINKEYLTGKHLLLVDDVITTGATLEACGSVILKIPATRLSIATLAWATK